MSYERGEFAHSGLTRNTVVFLSRKNQGPVNFQRVILGLCCRELDCILLSAPASGWLERNYPSGTLCHFFFAQLSCSRFTCLADINQPHQPGILSFLDAGILKPLLSLGITALLVPHCIFSDSIWELEMLCFLLVSSCMLPLFLHVLMEEGGLSTHDTDCQCTARHCICCMLLLSRMGAVCNSHCEGK